MFSENCRLQNNAVKSVRECGVFRKLNRRLQLAKYGLSAALAEAPYTTTVGNRAVTVFHSSFNIKWLRQAGISPKVIMDLGSYDGGDALRMAQEFPDCRVITVEADPARHEIVKNNISGSSVILEHYAVCENDGPVSWFPATLGGAVDAQGSLYRHTDHYQAIFPNVQQREQAEVVHGIRLDSLCRMHGITEIDLLHMDIEGAENAALHSLGAVRPKIIFAEMCEDRFIDGPSVDETHTFLLEIGYELVANLGSDRLYFHK